MSYFGRKAAIAAVAFATVGSTVFGGAALASDGDYWNKEGGDAKSGDAKGGECVYDAPLLADVELDDLLGGTGSRSVVDQSCDTYSGKAIGGSTTKY